MSHLLRLLLQIGTVSHRRAGPARKNGEKSGMRDLQNTWLIVVRQSPPPDFVELTHASVTATAQNKIAPHVELLLDCNIAVARRQLAVELRCGQTPFNSVSMGEPCLCPLLKKVGLTTIPGIGIARNRFFSNILRNRNVQGVSGFVATLTLPLTLDRVVQS